MSRSSRGSADPEPPQRLQVEINLTFNASAFNTFRSLPGLVVSRNCSELEKTKNEAGQPARLARTPAASRLPELGDRQHQPHQVHLPGDRQFPVDLLQVPVDGAWPTSRNSQGAGDAGLLADVGRGTWLLVVVLASGTARVGAWWMRPVEGRGPSLTLPGGNHSTESDPGSAGVSGIHLARPINRRFSGGRSRFCGRVELSAREHTGNGERRAVNTGREVHPRDVSGRGREGLSSSVEAR